MIQNISLYFSKKLTTSPEEQEILQYGFECIINTLIPTIFYLLFAIVEGMIFETIVWLVLFLLLRNYIGGYHASSHERCIAISTIYGLMILFCINYFKSIPITFEICICLSIALLHILFGPIINDTDLIGNYKKYKIIGFAIIITESVLMLIFNFYDINIHSCLFFSLISAAILHHIERIKRWVLGHFKLIV